MNQQIETNLLGESISYRGMPGTIRGVFVAGNRPILIVEGSDGDLFTVSAEFVSIRERIQ